MIRDELAIGMFVGFACAFVLAVIAGTSTSQVLKNETHLLRFCMTHSIQLEQCKIPEEGK
jgi:putative Ca2+/H+ antiporter (TMEM165/GDT1 family)